MLSSTGCASGIPHIDLHCCGRRDVLKRCLPRHRWILLLSPPAATCACVACGMNIINLLMVCSMCVACGMPLTAFCICFAQCVCGMTLTTFSFFFFSTCVSRQFDNVIVFYSSFRQDRVLQQAYPRDRGGLRAHPWRGHWNLRCHLGEEQVRRQTCLTS